MATIAHAKKRPSRWPATAALARTTLGVATAAVVGSAATTPGSGWYQQLRKPRFQPPPAAFPVAWTLLYADLAVTSALAVENAPDERYAERVQRALAANLVLNAGWSWVFFRAHRLGAATLTAAALTASSADLTRRVAAADPRGRALAAYPAWCAFATVLSAALWGRNRH
ncbi:TspO/MBR family protein [Nocardia harenae]|uniref:TspO/MBR family protein n=1 Tax=Nocardia harenae TaxID=358707 RepID=UPI000AEC1511